MAAPSGDLEPLSRPASRSSEDEESDATTHGAPPPCTIYIAGQCHPNPGPGGWAFLRVIDGTEWEESGADPDTTTTRMELTAALTALEDTVPGSHITVYARGQLLQHTTMKALIQNRQRTGCRTPIGQAVEHRDLWATLWDVAAERTVHWECLDGHAATTGPHDPQSSRVSELAAMARNQVATHPRRSRALAADAWREAQPGMDTTHAAFGPGKEASMSRNQAPSAPMAEDDSVQPALHHETIALLAECHALERRWAQLYEQVTELAPEWQHLLTGIDSGLADKGRSTGQPPNWTDGALLYLDLSRQAARMSSLAAEALQTCEHYTLTLQRVMTGVAPGPPRPSSPGGLLGWRAE